VSQRLDTSFFARPAEQVASSLLGTMLCRQLASGALLTAVILETEAYTGPQDLASHARNGARTLRNEPMWAKPGTGYVYFTYGMHYCFNVSCHQQGHPAAVLIRAAAAHEGTAQMCALRYGPPAGAKPGYSKAELADVLRGPARLCAGMNIGKEFSGVDLCQPQSSLWFMHGPDLPFDIQSGARIGLGTKAGSWADSPLRFSIAGHRGVSGSAAQNARQTLGDTDHRKPSRSR